MCDLLIQDERCGFEAAPRDTHLLLVKVTELWTTVITHSTIWKPVYYIQRTTVKE